MNIRDLLLTSSLLALAAGSAQAALVTIDFENVTPGAYTGSTEDGFDIASNPAAGGLLNAANIGSTYISSSAVDGPGSTTVQNILTVTASDMSTFFFNSIDLTGSSSTPGENVLVKGLRNGSLVDFDTFSTQGLSSFATFSANFLVGDEIDTLEIVLNARDQDTPTIAGYSNFADNIVLETVPVPATGLLMLGGIGAFAASSRRRRAKA